MFDFIDHNSVSLRKLSSTIVLVLKDVKASLRLGGLPMCCTVRALHVLPGEKWQASEGPAGVKRWESPPRQPQIRLRIGAYLQNTQLVV